MTYDSNDNKFIGKELKIDTLLDLLSHSLIATLAWQWSLMKVNQSPM